MFRMIPIFFLLAQCAPDETLSAYGAADTVYVLDDMDDAAFTARATLILSDAGRISGTGPCNSYNTQLTVPYPWFEIGPIAATRRACPDLDVEAAYFTALSEMDFAEVQGLSIILSNSVGRQMVFHAE